jgi:hypothetical protein
MLHEDRQAFISRATLIRNKNVSDKSCRELQNTLITFNIKIFDKLAVYETM